MTQSFDPPVGVAETLEPGVLRILAPNPSPMTFRGTNTYLLGSRDLAVIDPGPDSADHLAAILGAVPQGARISHILITHSHRDHSPLAAPLSAHTGAPVLAFGDSAAGQNRALDQMSGGEGIDHAFHPDRTLAHGARVTGDDWQVEVVATPGHMGNHISFASNGALFSGDHVMGWASSVVAPPEGDLTAFMASLTRLMARTDDRVYYPGHGAPITDPPARLRELYDHRKSREAQILQALETGPATAQTLARRIYTDINPRLLRAAAGNVMAHLIDLFGRDVTTPEGPLHPETRFALTR